MGTPVRHLPFDDAFTSYALSAMAITTQCPSYKYLLGSMLTSQHYTDTAVRKIFCVSLSERPNAVLAASALPARKIALLGWS